MTARVLVGDALTMLRTLPDASVQTCITSPPYWGLRDYGVAGQIGLEATPEEYVATLVDVFREVRRVLRKDGTVWLNLGDTYATAGGSGYQGKNGQRANRRFTQESLRHRDVTRRDHGRPHVNGRGEPQKVPGKNTVGPVVQPNRLSIRGLKPKDLVGIPWLVALALREDGWFLRSDIIWHKRQAMPESVRDRPTRAHDYLFLLTKSRRYFYDAAAIKEPSSSKTHARAARNTPAGWATDGVHEATAHNKPGVHPKARRATDGRTKQNASFSAAVVGTVAMRNKRTVWTLSSEPFAGAHFATFPPALVEPCVLAGSRRGDVVLDPFAGAGTTGLVADRLGRDSVLIELNPEYAALMRTRLAADAPLFTGGVA